MKVYFFIFILDACSKWFDFKSVGGVVKIFACVTVIEETCVDKDQSEIKYKND